jgi:hypothetical protein
LDSDGAFADTVIQLRAAHAENSAGLRRARGPIGSTASTLLDFVQTEQSKSSAQASTGKSSGSANRARARSSRGS